MLWFPSRAVDQSATEPAGASAPRARRWGTNTAEFAVIAPIYLMIVLGIVEIGRGLMVTMLLFNAARIGARTGTIEGTSTTDIQNAASNYLTSIGINGDNVTVNVNDNQADAINAKAGDEITVVCTVQASQITWVPGIQLIGYLTNNGQDIPLSGRFTLRRE